jgi:hypothetical protein
MPRIPLVDSEKDFRVPEHSHPARERLQARFTKRRAVRLRDQPPRRLHIGALIWLFASLIFPSSGALSIAEEPIPELPSVEIKNTRLAFNNGEHNAFTDLTEFKGKYFLTFRSCPDGHMVHPSASIIVLASDDLLDWKQVHQFSVPQRDTRDPHFVVFNDQLFVYTGTWYCGDDSPAPAEYDLNKHLGFAARSANGNDWESPLMLEGTYGHYIWRAETWGGRVFLCGRRKHHFAETGRGQRDDIESAMLESEDGLTFRTRGLFQTTRGDETAFQISSDGNLLAVGRRGRDPAQLIRSKAPFKTWQRSDLDRYIGGPLLTKWGKRWVVGGRQNTDQGPKTSLYWLVDDQLVEFARLPSGGDNSYPGFIALSPTRAVVSWYSSHETDDSGAKRTAIYLADLRIE